MIAVASLPLEFASPAVETSSGPRPLGDLLPAVLARYGISQSQPAAVPPTDQDDLREWLQIEAPQLLSVMASAVVS